MRAQPARNSARLLAPIALGLFAIFFFVVVFGSGSDEGAGKGGRTAAKSKRASKRTAKQPARKRTPATYTVKVGDNLPAIAGKTGLTVEQIQELNPELDPYGLQSGQKIKLRE
jgi:LysM repeat protein